MRFKLGPFPCVHCGRVLLIDTIKATESAPDTLDFKQFSVEAVLDQESVTEDWLKSEWRGMGRKDLIEKIYALRGEIQNIEYRTTPWYRKPWHRPRRFI